jgi:hypothetical protein
MPIKIYGKLPVLVAMFTFSLDIDRLGPNVEPAFIKS